MKWGTIIWLKSSSGSGTLSTRSSSIRGSDYASESLGGDYTGLGCFDFINLIPYNFLFKNELARYISDILYFIPSSVLFAYVGSRISSSWWASRFDLSVGSGGYDGYEGMLSLCFKEGRIVESFKGV